MEDWKNFFLQRMGKDENDSDYPVCESVNKWGIFCKDIPFKMFEKVKDPAKRSWYDEDGDDEKDRRDRPLIVFSSRSKTCPFDSFRWLIH